MKVIVIGAGITGVAAALHLQKDGHAVTLVDRIAPGSRGQTSYGNAGLLARCAVVPVAVPGLLAKVPKMLFDPGQPLFLRWSYLPRFLPWVIPFLRNGRMDKMRRIAEGLSHLTYDSVDQHKALVAGTRATAYLKEGDYSYVYGSASARVADRMGHELRRAFGLGHVVHDRADLEALDPHLAPEFVTAATFPDHGWITDPGAYVAALAAAFEERGGTLLEAEVTGLDPDGDGAQVRLATGKALACDRAVLAGGVWSRGLAERLGLKVPLESERGYHVMLRGTNFVPPHPYMIAAGKFAITPMQDGIRFAGTVEFGGVDAPPSDAPVAMLRSYIHRVYPALTWESEDVWMGRRPSTPDSLPMLGTVPGAPGVVLAFGSQHIGLTIGPRLGKMVANIVAGRPGNVDLTPYRTDRFG